MKLIKQGPSECQLATIAMLFDLNYIDVKDKAQELIGNMSWQDWIDKDGSKCFHDTIAQLLEALGIDPKWFKAKRCEASLAEVLFGPPSIDPPDLSGKGQLSIVWESLTAHAVAYEDGWIYDPAAEIKEPMLWEDWYKLHKDKGITIAKVIVTPLAPSSRATSN